MKVLNNLNFTVLGGDKVAFLGSDIAITTLFKILTEEETPMKAASDLALPYPRLICPRTIRSFKGNNLNLVDWMRQFSQDQTETYIRGFLGRMLFSGMKPRKGQGVVRRERVRCMLSRMMLSSANLLILDQPTNHLDLESITAVNDGLIDFKGVVLFSCYDHQFVQTVANRIIEITDDGIIDFRGTYDEYLETKQ